MTENLDGQGAAGRESVSLATAEPHPAARLAGVTKAYALGRRTIIGTRDQVYAIRDVSLSIARGETVGLVGESGSGKTTLARVLTRLVEPTTGTIEVAGVDITNLRGRDLRTIRRHAQLVFQDPYSSFDPLSPLAESVGEPLSTHFDLPSRERSARVAGLLDQVNLGREYLGRYPADLSGGQLQRAAVARALATHPELLVLDEPVSALDVSTQAQVINLLQDLQAEMAVAMLFIAHDLSVVHHISHRIAVMYLGRLVEVGPAERVYERPAHPYTWALLSAIPVPDPVEQRRRRHRSVRGDVPSSSDPPSGCAFRTRCPFAMDICTEAPPIYPTEDGGWAACHLHESGPQLRGASVAGLAAHDANVDAPARGSR